MNQSEIMARLEVIESGLFSPCPVCKSEIEPEYDKFGPTGKIPVCAYRLGFPDHFDDYGRVSKSNWEKRCHPKNTIAVCSTKCANAVMESWKKFPDREKKLRAEIEGKK